MKCKSHPCEQGAGVCASCLRERLVAILAAQNQLSPVQPQPPPVLFPQSVSPYASRRRSSYRFFSTPQVGPATGASAGDGGAGSRRFSLLSYMFGHRKSGEKESGPRASKASRARSWISALIHGRRRKPQKFPAEGARAPRRAMERGMSPETEESDCGSESGYTSASSGAWPMPTPSPMRRAHHLHGGRGVSGFAFCLSPLVQASPGFWRGQTPEVSLPGEQRGCLKPHHHHNHHHHSSGRSASLAKNRSRKLADFSRFR